MNSLGVATVLVLLLSSTTARADGGFLRPVTRRDIAGAVRNSYLDEPEQHAVLHFDGSTETLFLSVRYEGNVSEFGWIVPVPDRPEVELTAPGLIQDIARFEYNLRVEDWEAGRSGRGSPISFGGGGGGGAASKPKPVRVIEKKRLGLYDLTVLRARDSNALSQWLNENSFEIPDTPAAKAIIQHYVDADMYFCAIRVVSKSARKEKWLTPLTIRFNTERPFFPLRISALHTRPDATTHVQLHAFLPIDDLAFTGSRRVAHPSFTERERLFHVRDLPECSERFPSLRTNPFVLTTLRARYLGLNGMKDLWLATTKEQAAEVEAEQSWYACRDRELGLNPPDPYRIYLADYPTAQWATKARAALTALGDRDPEGSAKRVLAIAGQQCEQNQYREALRNCRRAGLIAPSLRAHVSETERRISEAESAYITAKWARLITLKESALSTGDAKEYFRHLVSILRVCADVHETESLSSDTTKVRYAKQAREEMTWLERHHAHQLNRRLGETFEEVEWTLRRDAARAQRGIELLRAISPDSAIGRKVEALSRRMRRGLR